MASLIAHIRVKPGREADFEQTSRALFAASHAREPALRRYEYFRGQAQGAYYCLLAFDDAVGFLTHQSSAHHEAAAAPLMEMVEALNLEWVDPVQGASPLPPTAPQPTPANADAAMRRYAETMPVISANWWTPLRKT